MSTNQTLRDVEEWGKTATDRDIQLQMLRVAVETRDKVGTIHAIISFMFVLWVLGVLAAIAAATTS